MADIHETEIYNPFRELGHEAKSRKTAISNFMKSYESATGRQAASDFDEADDVYVDVKPISSSRIA